MDSSVIPASGSGSGVFACNLDSECVAVPPAPNCCDNGYKTAVNVNQVAQFKIEYACKPQICPRYQVIERRIPECNNGTHACEMVDIAQIRCKGFIRNQHACPAGYDCVFDRPGGDIPGRCVPH